MTSELELKIASDLEPKVRSILHGLSEYETLSTAELAGRIAGNGAAQKLTRQAVMTQLVKLADNAPSLCTRSEKIATQGWAKGRTVRPATWHRIESPDMPQRPATPSAGAASPGTSLADRVQALEDWRAQLDARFDPLSTVL